MRPRPTPSEEVTCIGSGVITNPDMDWVKLEIATFKFGE